MRLDEAALMISAGALWTRHWPDLGPLNLTIRFSRRLVGKAGYYQPQQKLIVLSQPYARHYGEAEVRATLLHELAHHAVQIIYGHRARPHGPEFRAEALRVGAPRHCHDTAPLKRLTFACPNCGRRFARQRMPPRGGLACGPCCKRYAQVRFDSRFRLLLSDS